MKRMTSLLLALLVLVTVSPLFARGGGQQAGGTRVFRLADNQPDGYPTVLGDLAMAAYVEKASNGAMKIEVYNNSVLGDEKTTIEQTQTGAIHFIRVGLNPLSSINPIMNALAMPFLFRDRAHMFKVLDGPIGQELMESLKNQHLLGLCWLDAGFRNFYNSQRAVSTPADMVGLKIRVQESALMMDMVRFLGAQPTPMA
jgi:TRAP-type C4-dicarboxylate transport system substrate-binding protein